jgi:accessory Sec system glycosylation protein GtfA
MSIYIFSLLVGYEVSGVDHAIGVLHTFFKELKKPLRYIFTEVPNNAALKCYTKLGIDLEDMICAQFSMAGNPSIGSTEVQTLEHQFNGKKTFVEASTDRPVYIDTFSQFEKDGASVTRRSRRTFFAPDGSAAYDIVYDSEGKEQFVFPNGEVCSKGEFLLIFMQSLHFCEDDLIIIHRPGYLDFIEPLFLSKNKAHTAVFFHAGHDFTTGEDPYFNYLNPAYFSFFRHADELDAILVSTQEQKNDVINTTEKYGFPKVNVEVLPIFGISERSEVSERKPYSLISVSRLDPRKHIDLLIRASIKAHEHIPELTLDVYGTGSKEYIAMLKKLIEDTQSSSYITLKGYCDVSNAYDNYEAYLTTSTWETFGITLLEAVNAGDAMVGFRARYGNTLFIKPDENGYLVDTDFSRLEDEKYQNDLISDFADKIRMVFADPDRLKRFHKASYALAKGFSIESIKKMWVDYIGRFNP